LLLFVQWLGKHQEFSSNPFYVGGDSYSGLVVPATVQEISKGIYMFYDINPLSPFLKYHYCNRRNMMVMQEIVNAAIVQ